MAVATGNNASILMARTSTLMTGQATTSLGGNAYQITTASRRVLDPRQTITVLENGSPADQPYTVNTFTGTVQFATAPTTPITVTAHYLTLAALGTCSGITLNADNTFAETMVIGTAYKNRHLTMRDVSGSIDLIDFETTIDSNTVHAICQGGVPLVLQLTLDSGTNYFAWVLLTTENLTVTPDDILQTSFNFSGVRVGEEQTIHGIY